jgi:probable rRNA maturation factor
MSALRVSNRQRRYAIHAQLLRQVLDSFLSDLPALEHFDIDLCLVNATEMARLNALHLGHAGPTDVITFDYASPPSPRRLHGEIVVCVDEAIANARRFRTSWPDELVRYVIHGVLHLRGYPDDTTANRQRMRRTETRWLKKLRQIHALDRWPKK